VTREPKSVTSRVPCALSAFALSRTRIISAELDTYGMLRPAMTLARAAAAVARAAVTAAHGLTSRTFPAPKARSPLQC